MELGYLVISKLIHCKNGKLQRRTIHAEYQISHARACEIANCYKRSFRNQDRKLEDYIFIYQPYADSL